MMEREPRLTVGWATKIINVYSEDEGVPSVRRGGIISKRSIHPPIDSGLWLGLARRFPNRPDILERTNCVSRIKDIADCECYRRIIDGCRDAAKALDCELDLRSNNSGPGLNSSHQPRRWQPVSAGFSRDTLCDTPFRVGNRR